MKFAVFELERTAEGLRVHQESYARDLLDQYHDEIPGEENAPAVKVYETSSLDPDADVTSIVKRAQALIGQLLWLSNRTRPDLAYAVNLAAQKIMANPCEAVARAEHAICYLGHAPGVSLHYKPAGKLDQLRFQETPTSLDSYSDASFAADEQCRSFGCIQLFWGGLLLMQFFHLFSQGANCFLRMRCRRPLSRRQTCCSMMGLMVGCEGHNRLVLACTRGNLLRRTWGSCAKPCEHYNAKELFLTGVHPRKFGACCFFLQSIAIEAHLCRLSFMAKLRLVFCTHWCKHGHHNVCLLCGTFHARLNWTSATTSLVAVGSGSFTCCVLSEKLTFISCGREQCQDMHTMLAVSFATGVVSKQSHSNAALIGASSMLGWGMLQCFMMLRMPFPHLLMPLWTPQCVNMPVLTMWNCLCKGTAKLLYFCETHSSLHTQSCKWDAGICKGIAWPLHSSCLCTFQLLKSGMSHVKRYHMERRFLQPTRSLANVVARPSALLRTMQPKHTPYQRRHGRRLGPKLARIGHGSEP